VKTNWPNDGTCAREDIRFWQQFEYLVREGDGMRDIPRETDNVGTDGEHMADVIYEEFKGTGNSATKSVVARASVKEYRAPIPAKEAGT